MSFTKKLDEIKIGIAISTFTEEKTELKRYAIIDKSLKSLQEVLAMPSSTKDTIFLKAQALITNGYVEQAPPGSGDPAIEAMEEDDFNKLDYCF